MPPTKRQKRLKALPHFGSEDEERDFWATHDSVDYIDWSQGEPLSLSNLKPTARTISLRLPVTMIMNLKLLANKRDVPYQSLLKTFLADRLKQEMRTAR
jgi:predicted DNA binding CopG/RHH family protein